MKNIVIKKEDAVVKVDAGNAKVDESQASPSNSVNENLLVTLPEEGTSAKIKRSSPSNSVNENLSVTLPEEGTSAKIKRVSIFFFRFL